jgi:hypothetical protein
VPCIHDDGSPRDRANRTIRQLLEVFGPALFFNFPRYFLRFPASPARYPRVIYSRGPRFRSDFLGTQTRGVDPKHDRCPESTTYNYQQSLEARKLLILCWVWRSKVDAAFSKRGAGGGHGANHSRGQRNDEPHAGSAGTTDRDTPGWKNSKSKNTSAARAQPGGMRGEERIALAWGPTESVPGAPQDDFGLPVFLTRGNECGVRRDTMTDRFYTFHTTPEQLRRVGARGGRAYGRNRRARRAPLATPPGIVPPRTAPPATTAESIAALDARFPWLRGAEKRRS